MADQSDKPVYLSERQARRIAAQVLARERAPKNPPPPRGDYGRGHMAYGLGAKSPGGGIGAAGGGGTSPGSATCVMYDFDPTTGTFSASTRSETVYNVGGAIAGNTFFLVGYRQGVPFADVVPC